MNAPALIEALTYVREHAPLLPETALVLGSGLGDYTEQLDNRVVIPVQDIPRYPHSTVEGHKGELVFARSNAMPILAFRGRVHFYETGEPDAVLFPVRIAAALGVRVLILTNAAGGINRQFLPGDLMVIADQINLTFRAVTPRTHEGRFLQTRYDPDLMRLCIVTAEELAIPVHRGVYAGVNGPSYETAAEIEMIYRLGGDAVGMSTVHEAALAQELGMRVLGISCITNKATGTAPGKLDHAEVTEVATRVKQTFARLLDGILQNLRGDREVDLA